MIDELVAKSTWKFCRELVIVHPVGSINSQLKQKTDILETKYIMVPSLDRMK